MDSYPEYGEGLFQLDQAQPKVLEEGSVNEFRQFLNIATGSCCELEPPFTIPRNLNYLDKAAFNTIIKPVGEIQKILHPSIKDISIANFCF